MLTARPEFPLRALPNLFVPAARLLSLGDKQVKLRACTILRDICIPIWSLSPGPSGDIPANPPHPAQESGCSFLVRNGDATSCVRREQKRGQVGGLLIGAFPHDAREFTFFASLKLGARESDLDLRPPRFRVSCACRYPSAPLLLPFKPMNGQSP